jgi:hypothetical protein
MKKELQQLAKTRNWIMLGIVILIFIVSAIAAEKRLSGYYSINPSFSTKVNYSFDSYAEISGIIKDLIDKCSDLPDTYTIDFIQKLNNENYKFYFKHRGAAVLKEWPESCESKEADFFYDFIEFYTDCTSTPNADCRCEMALDRYFEGKATIKTSEGVAVLAEKGFSEEVPAGFPADVVYNNKKASIGSLTGQSKIVIIKNKDGASQIADQKTKEFPNLCKIDNRFFKACIVSKKEVLALNPSTGAVGKQNVTYRFAFETKNNPPKPIIEMKAFDEQKASNRLIVRWNESDETDLGSYAIYYSKTDLLTQNLKQCTSDSAGICTKVEISNNPTVIKEIDLSQLPVFDNGKYVYTYTDESGKSVSEPLLDKTLYEVKSAKESYTFYVLEVPSNEKYYLAVTAIDLSGKEIDNTNKDNEGKLESGKNYAYSE